jgi:hypothetical protein
MGVIGIQRLQLESACVIGLQRFIQSMWTQWMTHDTSTIIETQFWNEAFLKFWIDLKLGLRKPRNCYKFNPHELVRKAAYVNFFCGIADHTCEGFVTCHESNWTLLDVLESVQIQSVSPQIFKATIWKYDTECKWLNLDVLILQFHVSKGNCTLEHLSDSMLFLWAHFLSNPIRGCHVWSRLHEQGTLHQLS